MLASVTGAIVNLEAALIAAVTAQAGALGLVWRALMRKIEHAEAACEEDRKALRSLMTQVKQLDRRDSAPLPLDEARR